MIGLSHSVCTFNHDTANKDAATLDTCSTRPTTFPADSSPKTYREPIKSHLNAHDANGVLSKRLHSPASVVRRYTKPEILPDSGARKAI